MFGYYGTCANAGCGICGQSPDVVGLVSACTNDPQACTFVACEKAFKQAKQSVASYQEGELGVQEAASSIADAADKAAGHLLLRVLRETQRAGAFTGRHGVLPDSAPAVQRTEGP
eukprot:44901-Lingulodinium_polyedra.AAC.1